MDPVQSPDPVIRHLAIRWKTLTAERECIDGLLAAYARQVKPAEIRRIVPSIEHFSMLDDTGCGCAICMDWETRRAELTRVQKLMPEGHKWSLCACKECRFIAAIHVGFLAAINRRDLLIEMAFHANHHTAHGEKVMAWTEEELPRYSAKWLVQEASRQPMSSWLARCEAVVGPQVSGTVFHA